MRAGRFRAERERRQQVGAARRYGLTPTGTMAHSFVEAFLDERAAFEAFAADYPAGTVYQTEGGVRAAIADLSRLPAPARLVRGPTPPRPGITTELRRLREDVRSTLLDRLAAEHLPLSR